MAKLPGTMPAKDIVAVCTLNLNTYTVTFKVNGEVYHTAQVKYTFPIPYPENPSVDGYTFKGWDSSISEMPNSDVTINAVLEKVQTNITFGIRAYRDNSGSTTIEYTRTCINGTTWGEYLASITDGKEYFPAPFNWYYVSNASGDIIVTASNNSDKVMPLCSNAECTQTVSDTDVIQDGVTYWANMV